MRQQLRQQPDLRRRTALPGALDPVDQVGDAIGNVVVVQLPAHARGAHRLALVDLPLDLLVLRLDAVTDGLAVHAGQGGQEVQLAAVHTATGASRRDLHRELAVDLRLARVTEPQLDAGLHQVLHRRADLRPTRGGDENVHAVGQTVGREVQHILFQRLELFAERAPTIDDQERVAEQVILELAAPLAVAVVVHALDAVLLEPGFPLGQHRLELRDRPPNGVLIAPGAVTAHMRQAAQRGDRTTTEVDAVELHLPRGVGQRHRSDHRADRVRLARADTADERAVPALTAQVQRHRILPLVIRHVDQAHRELQPAAAREARRRVAAVVGLLQRRQQSVQSGRCVQRRQPHLVGGRALAADLVDDDLEVGRREVVLFLLDLLDDRLLRLRRLLDEVRDEEPRHLVAGDRRRAALQRGATTTGLVHVAGHERGAEPLHAVGVLQISVTTGRGQIGRVGHTDGRAGVRRVERLQTDPVRQVRIQAAQLALFQPLGGQQQVDLKRTTQSTDHHEQLGEVRLLRQQLGELVDDHEQRGQRLLATLVAGLAHLPVVPDVLRARLVQDLLAAVHLTGQRVLHAVDQ